MSKSQNYTEWFTSRFFRLVRTKKMGHGKGKNVSYYTFNHTREDVDELVDFINRLVADQVELDKDQINKFLDNAE